MSVAEKLRLPDLWLKRELVMAVLPPGTSTECIDNDYLARLSLDEDSKGSKISKLFGAIDAIGVADDLYGLAATFEYMILHPVDGAETHDKIMRFAEEREDPKLMTNAIAGTFGDFARALLTVLSGRKDFPDFGYEHFVDRLTQVVQRALLQLFEEASDLCAPLGLLHGKSRDWLANASHGERIIRQPLSEVPEIPQGDFVQVVASPGTANQCLFGFELRSDTRVITDPWHRVGGWFSPRFQPQGVSLFLLPEAKEDDEAARVSEPGEYWLQIIGIDADPRIQPPKLPHKLKALVDGKPVNWPRGYAEAMATVAYAKREALVALKAEGKNQRVVKLAEHGGISLMSGNLPSPSRVRLYRTQYRVV